MCVLRKTCKENGLLGKSLLSRNGITISVPEGASRVLRVLHGAGYEAYVVGGCVRDSILGRKPSDWDVTTSATPQQVKELFHRTIDTGIQHGTVTVRMNHQSYEVTTYRIDGEYEDGRHPDSVIFTRSLAEDLKRRDFTVNAMAYNEEEGLVDEFDGLGDMDRKIIRAVGDPVQRFTEDALRMMRGIRFCAQLGYRLEDRTGEAAQKMAANLRKISAERIRVELEKLLLSPHPEELREAYRLGLTAQFLPEFDTCMTCEQHNPHHCYTVGEHLLHAVMAVRADKVLRLAMLLHDIAKPEKKTTDGEGVDHFHGHAAASADMANAILRRLKYDNDTREKAVRLISWHDRDLGDTPAEVRHSIAGIGTELFPLLLEVKRADVMAQSEFERQEKLDRIGYWEGTWRAILHDGDCLDLKSLAISGKDLLDAGMQPGRGIGKALDFCLEDVLNHPEHNTRGYLLGEARKSFVFLDKRDKRKYI